MLFMTGLFSYIAVSSAACVLDGITNSLLVHPILLSTMCEPGFVKTSVLVRLKAKPDLGILDDADLAECAKRLEHERRKPFDTKQCNQ